jgi:hypothetical protein
LSTSDFSQRVALASHATGGSKPGTAVALANSDLNDSDVQLVGTFIQGMGTSLVARLARASGATTHFSPDQRSQLDALKEQYADVDASAQKDAADPRGWLSKAFDVVSGGIGAGVETAVDSEYSPLHWALTGFDKALDAVKLPVRILSSAVDASNDDEIDAQMAAQGYDKNSAWDYVQFMYNQGDSAFHDLDPLREEYTPEAVDLAMQYYADPEKFNQLQQTDPGFAQKVSAITNRPDWNDVLDHVDRKHISVGRDIANLVLPKSMERGALFTAMSGTLDAAFTLAADPTLIAGKAGLIARAADVGAESVMKGGALAALRPSNQVARAIDFARNGAQRRGVATIRDTAGIKQLFTKGTDVGNSAAAFIEDANKLRTLTDEGEKAALLAGMSVRHKGWMPFLDEVSGRKLVVPEHELVSSAIKVDGAGVATEAPVIDGILKDVNGVEHFTRQGNAITTVEDFGDYLASTTGLLRLGNGYAAQAGRMLPGKTNWRLALEDKIGRAKLAERRVNKTYAKREEAYQGVTWDHSDAAAGKLSRYLPVKEEASLLDEIDQLPEQLISDAKTRGTVVRNMLERGTADGTTRSTLQKARANWERRARRMSTLLPTVTHLDVNAADGAEQVRRFARLYLARTDADRLAAMWTNGDAAARRAVARGMLEQSFEASGLTLSEAGQEFISRFRLDQAELDRQMYGFDGTDVVKTERGDVHMALYPSQLSDRIALPSFRDMHYIASKFSSASYFTRTVGARFYSPTMDRALTGIKMGWITSPASGLRNAIDELVGVVVRGGGGDHLKARVLYTSETRKWRAKVRRDSKRYQDLLKQYGTAKTREILGAEVKSAGDRVREAGGSLSEVREAERAAMLEARIKHRIPLALRGAADKVNDVVFHELLGRYFSVRGAFRGDEGGVRPRAGGAPEGQPGQPHDRRHPLRRRRAVPLGQRGRAALRAEGRAVGPVRLPARRLVEDRGGRWRGHRRRWPRTSGSSSATAPALPTRRCGACGSTTPRPPCRTSSPTWSAPRRATSCRAWRR